MNVPELLTARLRLRPLRAGDEEPLYELLSDPEAARFLPFPVTRELVAQHVDELLTADYPEGMGSYAWEDRETGEFAGHGDLAPSKELGDGRPEVGWYLMPSYQGRGLATEALDAVLGHAFGTLRVPEVVALVHEENVRSRRVAERLGFAEAGRGLHYGGPHIVYVRGAAGAVRGTAPGAA
ncbi:GNAT family N-acetyltransferase [Bailinhaonella thermotolerans]|uniref:GNAT family N-acetyltransferase n=1 Tax=Bailinhaonella thermotolerans TaxID=1070861 RepID=UPI00192A585B|nr:GNAT family N-acetyltransferase [Bailinhaonella thermotolerans]